MGLARCVLSLLRHCPLTNTNVPEHFSDVGRLHCRARSCGAVTGFTQRRGGRKVRRGLKLKAGRGAVDWVAAQAKTVLFGGFLPGGAELQVLSPFVRSRIVQGASDRLLVFVAAEAKALGRTAKLCNRLRPLVRVVATCAGDVYRLQIADCGLRIRGRGLQIRVGRSIRFEI